MNVTPDEKEIARAQEVTVGLTTSWIARMNELNESAKGMVRNLGFRQDIGPVAAENGAALVREYGALLDRALRPWGRHEAEPLLEQIKAKEGSKCL